MANQETCAWIGKSGTRYTYYVYTRHPSIKEGQEGNYIYAKKNQQGQWVPVYIGQGDLSKRATTNHHRIRCIDSKGASHVHLRLDAVEEHRLAEEKDLLANYTNALAPTGCNVSVTG